MQIESLSLRALRARAEGKRTQAGTGGGGMAGGNSPQGPQQQFHNVDEKFKFETPVRQESLE